MAINWNNEYYVALEGKDLQANAMAIDNTGTFVLLAGRRYIAIRNLNEECEIVQKFPRHSKYDVGSAEWNPTFQNKELCVISSNQRLEVLAWREELIQINTLKAHTRVITDLNWHQIDPNIIASCSVDTFIYVWDLRDTRRPSLSLSAIAEASQVRWNRISPYLLATAHDGDIKIWDQRKGSAPIQYISAHLAKIHGLDWSPNSETQLATSSQDCTVKFFDMTNPRRAENILNTSAPVWRARYTPFGNGLVTVVVPQLRRGENGLLLWNIGNRTTPMHTFVGHKDVVLEFEWRKKHSGENHYQLVTWSKDQSLLIWKIEPYLQKLCGCGLEEEQEPIESVINIPTENVELVKTSIPKLDPLQQEYSLLNIHIPNLEVKNMNLEERKCTFGATINSSCLNVEVYFPPAYPQNIAPIFELKDDSTLGDSIAKQIMQSVNRLAQQRVAKNRTCLESCLRHMVTLMDQLVSDPEIPKMYDSFIPNVNTFGDYNDAYIPFPRTSGARFCSVDILVCFGRQANGRKFSNKLDILTPRALSALNNVHNKRSNDQISVSAYYYQKPRNRFKHADKLIKPVIHLYKASGLFLVNRQLAEDYILDGVVTTICKHNAAAAALVGRWDLVQSWALAELVASPQRTEDVNSWYKHPFGNELMHSLISHYASQSDVQMAAMLACIFGREQVNASRKISVSSPLPNSSSVGSPQNDMVLDGWVFPYLKTPRSHLDNKLQETVSNQLMTNSKSVIYESYKLGYAETLHRWGLLYSRAEVLKYRSSTPNLHTGLEFTTRCKYCLKFSKKKSCITCRKPTLNCVICHISVRGLANGCVYCGHGGHTNHLLEWFQKKDVCPTGCGCRCLFESENMFLS